jgi:hypothetical protein
MISLALTVPLIWSAAAANRRSLALLAKKRLLWKVQEGSRADLSPAKVRDVRAHRQQRRSDQRIASPSPSWISGVD